MRAIIQRVKRAKITIENGEVHEIDQGFVVYICVMKGDTQEQAKYLQGKICGLRIFSDENDKLNLSIKDVKGDMLIVSNFTVAANCRRGNRPSFELAERPDDANTMYEYFLELVKAEDGLGNIKTGVFGAHMEIESVCDGPINLIMDTDVISK